MGTDGDQNIIIKTLINLVTISKKALIVTCMQWVTALDTIFGVELSHNVSCILY